MINVAQASTVRDSANMGSGVGDEIRTPESYNEVPTHPHWSNIRSKPATATRWPNFNEVTGKPSTYPTTWNEIAGKPETFAPAEHDHDARYLRKAGGKISGRLAISNLETIPSNYDINALDIVYEGSNVNGNDIEIVSYYTGSGRADSVGFKAAVAKGTISNPKDLEDGDTVFGLQGMAWSEVLNKMSTTSHIIYRIEKDADHYGGRMERLA